MLIAFLSLLNGTSPGTCLMKAAAAFLVFAGIGLILRYVLADTGQEQRHDYLDTGRQLSGGAGSLDVIVPGTSVADLLASQPNLGGSDDGS